MQRNYSSAYNCMPRVIQGMDAAAVIIVNDEVVAGVSQERFDKKKKSSSFPFDAIDYCLSKVGCDFMEIDAICFNFDFQRYKYLYKKESKSYYDSCLSPEQLMQTMCRHYNVAIPPEKFYFTDHHEAHFFSALSSSPIDECLAIVIDGVGEAQSTTVYDYKEGELRRLGGESATNSLGIIYSLVTHLLGFNFNEDEYKVMGMASLGNQNKYSELFEEIILLKNNGRIEIPCLSLNKTFQERYFYSESLNYLKKLLLPYKEMDSDFNSNISASLQNRFYQALFHISSYYQKLTGHKNLILSGGCAENCSAIGELKAKGLFDNIHVGFASGDEGTAFGAGVSFVYKTTQKLVVSKGLPFWGPEPLYRQGDLSLHKDYSQYYNKTEYSDDNEQLMKVAKDIGEGHIVAVCRGNSEFGSRALGNRSILADPRLLSMKDKVNKAIKKRESFRPFAPVVIQESAHQYFCLNETEHYPYMTMLVKVRQEYIDKLKAVTHVDGTARVQTVKKEENIFFYLLLKEIEKEIDFPILLNTSFNVNHQPIISTYDEALDSVLNMDIDILYINNIRYEKVKS